MTDESENYADITGEGSSYTFNEVCSMHFNKQAQFFLNGMWKTQEEHAEEVWNYCKKMSELSKKFDEGSQLDEWDSHKFLEYFGETLTVIKMRERLRTIDLNNDGEMSLIEYLLTKYEIGVQDMMDQPQGKSVLLEKAQAALEEVQAEIKAIQDKVKTLEEAAEGTGVKAKKAKGELFELLNADQTDLNEKVLHAEAAVRKARKEGGEEQPGVLWWIERELKEASKFKPKGGIKKDAFEK